ncbi:MAG: four helix bundle protein [Chitinophagaceae bacterium]|nr:four helix bundle protein [Chitinophagaceae bacterium]
MKENVLKEKSYSFALEIIKAYRLLSDRQREFVLSKQLLRAGTSIGANIEEADGAQSKRDFLHKVSISFNEAKESRYWLRLLKDSNLLKAVYADVLLSKLDELLKIMTAIIKTTKANIKNEK